MKTKELRAELNLPETSFTDKELENFLIEGNNRAHDTKYWLGDLICCYEICRRLGDPQGMQFYKFKILGKMGIVTPKEML